MWLIVIGGLVFPGRMWLALHTRQLPFPASIMTAAVAAMHAPMHTRSGQLTSTRGSASGEGRPLRAPEDGAGTCTHGALACLRAATGCIMCYMVAGWQTGCSMRSKRDVHRLLDHSISTTHLPLQCVHISRSAMRCSSGASQVQASPKRPSLIDRIAIEGGGTV